MTLLWLAWSTAAAAVPVGPGVQVLLRVLSYDRALPGRARAPLDVFLVHVGSDPLSAEQAREAVHAFAQLGSTAVQGLPVAATVSVDARAGVTPEQLAGADVIVLCRGTEPVVAAAAAWASTAHVPVLALDGAQVGTGPAIGLTLAQARLGLVVDLTAARAQGMDLSSEVLQLATLVSR